jgi:hypothetical protein
MEDDLEESSKDYLGARGTADADSDQRHMHAQSRERRAVVFDAINKALKECRTQL